MGNATCPHCGATVTPGSAYCESCGKVVSVASAGPSVIEGGSIAATPAGQQLQSEELGQQLKKATGALLAVAILKVVFGTILVFVLGAGDAGGNLGVVLAAVYGIGLVFFGLYLWARKDPFPAAIVGLVVFVTVHLLDAVMDPASLGRGIVVKIIIVVILVKAIQAGAKYRELMNQSGV